MVGKARSCTACRQAKMACDARSKTPLPCSRCSSKNQECRFDKNFRRISTRQMAKDIANQLHIVRASQNPAQRNTPSISPSVDVITPAQVETGPALCPSFLLSTNVEGFPAFTLGDLSIPSEVIIELILHFGRHHYAHSPFVQPIRSVARLASDSPMLFWTIVLIASQHHEKHSDLYEELFFPHRELLSPLSNTAIRSVEEIHAILLLCLWPIPKRRALLDPAWSYIGIAVNSCMRMNLHKPLPQGHFGQGWPGWQSASASVSVQTQRLTWLACFSIGTQIATFLGFVPPLSSYHQLKYVRKAIDSLAHVLLPEHRASLAIHEGICNYSVSLEDAEDPVAHFTLTQTFDGNLDTVKQVHSANWTSELDILFHFAKLNLYAMAVLPPLQDPSAQADTQNVINRQALLLRGFDSATSLIADMKTLSLCPVSGSERHYGAGKLSFYPKHFFTQLFFAAIFLFRTVANTALASATHRARAIEGMEEVLAFYRLIPRHRDVARATRLLEVLLSKARSEDASALEPWSFTAGGPVATNWLGASLLWDTIIRIWMRGNGGDGAARQTREGNAENGFVIDRLPPAPEMRPQVPDVQTAFIDAPLVQDQGVTGWTSWDEYLNDFGFDIDQQIFW